MNSKKTSKPITKKHGLAILLLAVAAATSIIIAFSGNNSLPTAVESTTKTSDILLVDEQPESTEATSIVKNNNSQNEMLLYLIEEEKLAHDVYTLLYQTYGSRVFANILESEQTHQNRVLELLQARNIADPRSAELGIFANKDLQSLYDSLILQAKQSVLDAYKVGAAIEQKDINDITKQLSGAVDSDIINALTALRNGSENHLRAFNRQINRY